MMLEHHSAGEVWAAAAWDLRVMLGCHKDKRFAENIVDNVRTRAGSNWVEEARNIFQKRGLTYLSTG
jgi:hypothetical protein